MVPNREHIKQYHLFFLSKEKIHSVIGCKIGRKIIIGSKMEGWINLDSGRSIDYLNNKFCAYFQNFTTTLFVLFYR